MRTTAEQILKKYRLNENKTARFLDAACQYNTKQVASEIEVSSRTVRYYKEKFRKMTQRERSIIREALAEHPVLTKE